MKCIKTIKKTNSREIGEVIRIEENEAENKVKTGFWAYCPKSEWKTYTFVFFCPILILGSIKAYDKSLISVKIITIPT